MKRKGFFARLADLWRGFWGVKLDDAEAKNAEAVYHNAINDHVRHHDKLKDAIARLVYLRNRLDADLQERSRDLELVDNALRRAVSADDDTQAMALIRKKRTFEEEIDRLQAQLAAISGQVDKAKGGMAEVVAAIKQLKEERAEMLARKAHALARRDAHAVLQRLSDTSQLLGSVTALENVRESIFRLEQQVDLDDESVEVSGEVSMAALRREAEADRDRQMLAELKEQIGSRLLVESGLPDLEPVTTGGNGKIVAEQEQPSTL